MTASTPDRYIHYLSDTWEGKIHDYRLLKEELPPHLPWFNRVVVRVDSGYVGIAKDYDCQEVIIPKKKPPRQELTAEDKAENKAKATQRIAVEHAFGGLKRYRILSDRLRMHDLYAHNIILGVCAGIWNFYITN